MEKLNGLIDDINALVEVYNLSKYSSDEPDHDAYLERMESSGKFEVISDIVSELKGMIGQPPTPVAKTFSAGIDGVSVIQEGHGYPGILPTYILNKVVYCESTREVVCPYTGPDLEYPTITLENEFEVGRSIALRMPMINSILHPSDSLMLCHVASSGGNTMDVMTWLRELEAEKSRALDPNDHKEEIDSLGVYGKVALSELCLVGPVAAALEGYGDCQLHLSMDRTKLSIIPEHADLDTVTWDLDSDTASHPLLARVAEDIYASDSQRSVMYIKALHLIQRELCEVSKVIADVVSEVGAVDLDKTSLLAINVKLQEFEPITGTTYEATSVDETDADFKFHLTAKLDSMSTGFTIGH